MNILVFGKDGQLGKAFAEQLKAGQFNQDTIRFVGRADCDLTNAHQVSDLVQSFQPQVIVNAAAYTAVDKAESESESELAFAINATAPEVMARYAAQQGATLLHFSTDYVFDGTKQGSYTELDLANPLGVYGKSKEAGERAIVQAFSNGAGQYAILRTSWVYGDGGNFIRTILRLAKERTELGVINDQFGVPTSAQWLAEVGSQLVMSLANQQFSSGIYHAVPAGETNWHGLAQLVVQSAVEMGVDLQASPGTIAPIPASEYPSPAPRPMNSRLATNKLQSELERLDLVSKLPHWNTPWDKQVTAYVQQQLAD
ncbi:dTDP-4-dehydrorhamnose reductase [Polynucleobacter sp. es-MAR-4]|uniref:dTDP-4-dehydrorhamnose reductase n=1 Tax=Polynucleobacter sp. es-MAR-4 TaxID=1855655 RepID=UPI001C0B58A9|nr:dTDP-4-dehydrorhamnose reductase [Polynucleobacter sp. es-MAR-4]MBU3637643.1 dTDP-4-dehydrorhamnose reductase [Polynucleobacter sp. es-MAR-4]